MIDELSLIAGNIKTMVKQTSPGKWCYGSGSGVDEVVRAGEEPIPQVFTTDPPMHAPANGRFTAYAHESADRIADGVLALIREVQALNEDVTRLRYELGLAKESGKGFPKVGR